MEVSKQPTELLCLVRCPVLRHGLDGPKRVDGVAATSLGVLDHSLPLTSAIKGSVPVVHQGGQQECCLPIKRKTMLCSSKSS